MTRHRRHHPRSRWTRRLVRLLSALVLALLASQLTVAYAFVAVDDCGESCPDDDDEGDCPCPLDCAAGCCAARVPAVPPSPIVPVLLAPPSADLVLLVPERAPPSPEVREVLHVPRHLT
ncbi:hypothetical protein WME79_15520 [Sorangium sp. So ce726]|uniref:hypothetical protein n=1 Tax=Sorangium sp. So ce726 TaxID=3133319 RepID=UPI003F5F0BBB